MSVMPEQLPTGLLEVHQADSAIKLTVDATLYPLAAIYGASYVFIDRCYVFLDRPREGAVRVTLAAKGAVDEDGVLQSLAGSFANELLSCAWRHEITVQNRILIETVTQQALGSAVGAPSLSALADFDFSDDALDDPLGIAMSWEEKYAKGDSKSASASDTTDEHPAAAEEE